MHDRVNVVREVGASGPWSDSCFREGRREMGGMIVDVRPFSRVAVVSTLIEESWIRIKEARDRLDGREGSCGREGAVVW